MSSTGILLFDDKKIIADGIRDRLFQHFSVYEKNSPGELLDGVDRSDDRLIIICSEGRNIADSLELVKGIRARDPFRPVILLSRQSSEERILTAFRAGVNDYLGGFFRFEDLNQAISRVLPSCAKRSHAANRVLPSAIGNVPAMVGESRAMQEILAYLARVAKTESTVLITGETGTGKELAAELVHSQSSRADKTFLCVNSAAIPESLAESELFGYEKGAFTGADTTRNGLFEQSDGGTIFLDEISDMSSTTQAKVLRILESRKVMGVGGRRERSVNLRVIAATNKSPERMVRAGTFRSDLYYRLNIARVDIPPLRSRKEDIPALLDLFINRLNLKYGKNVKEFSPKAWTALFHYDWPGNIRELKNILESTFITLDSEGITYSDLPKTFRSEFEEVPERLSSERDRILSALFMANWNKSKAAEKLKWSRMTLYRKIDKHNIVEHRPIRRWIMKQ